MGERLGLALALERRPAVLPTPHVLSGGSSVSATAADSLSNLVSVPQWTEELPKFALDRHGINKIVMGYLISEGHKEAAELFMKESGIESPVNMDVLSDCVKLRQLIVDGNVLDAIVLLNDLVPMLLEENRVLLFKLQQQYVIELIRDKKLDDALVYSQNFLSERVNEDVAMLSELEKTLTLLAFEDPFLSPFSDLMTVEHRQEVASSAVQALLSIRGWNSSSDSDEPSIEGILHLASWCQDNLARTGLRTPVITEVEFGKLSTSTPVSEQLSFGGAL